MRPDAARFQSWIRERHHRLRGDDRVFHAAGLLLGPLGAQMVSLKFNLLHALLHKKVYHFPTTHYVNPLRCPSRSFDCYFERPSNCTRATHAAAEEVKIHWCFDLPRRRLSKLAGLRSVHSKAWYNAQLAAFLFRPNAELRAFRGVVEPAMEMWGGGGAAERAKGKLPQGGARGALDAAAAASGTVVADGTAGFAGNGCARAWRRTCGGPTSTPRTTAPPSAASPIFCRRSPGGSVYGGLPPGACSPARGQADLHGAAAAARTDGVVLDLVEAFCDGARAPARSSTSTRATTASARLCRGAPRRSSRRAATPPPPG